MPVPLLPRMRKNKREVPHDTLFFQPLILNLALYNWQELENLLWLSNGRAHEEKLYFRRRMEQENKTELKNKDG